MSEISQLKWRCRRGVKELDVLFCRYLDLHYNKADEEEKQAFSEFLTLEDPDILDILRGNTTLHIFNQTFLILIEKLKCGEHQTKRQK